MKSDLVTIKEISQYLNIKESTLYLWVETGEVPYYRFGKMIRLREDDVDRWVEGHRKDTIDTDREAIRILKGTSSLSGVDMDAFVRKTIAEEKNRKYIVNHGKPSHIKGLRKEVKNGA